MSAMYKSHGVSWVVIFAFAFLTFSSVYSAPAEKIAAKKAAGNGNSTLVSMEKDTPATLERENDEGLRLKEKKTTDPRKLKRKKTRKIIAIIVCAVGVSLLVGMTLFPKKTNKPYVQPIPAPVAHTYSNCVLTVKGISYELAAIPPGEFRMGSVSKESFYNERPTHNVRISKGFWLGKTEVTQDLWVAVMGKNPSWTTFYNTYPVGYSVDSVSWEDCQTFIKNLNLYANKDIFRMPTEAEWEYTCRAGTTGDRYGNVDDIAFVGGNFDVNNHPKVGQKQPNAWGLFDMLGLANEWCQDWYGDYSSDDQTDPTGPISGSQRVYRGGSCDKDPDRSRASFRTSNQPNNFEVWLGFRLAANSAGE